MKIPIIPVIALAAITFAIYHVMTSQGPVSQAEPPIEPARSPYASKLAGAGIVESRTENIEIAADVSGVVSELLISEGQTIDAGQLLLKLDARDVEADLKIHEASLQNVMAQYQRLERMPRAEEVPPAKADVTEAEAEVRQTKDAYERQQKLNREKIGTDEELVTARSQLEVAQAKLEKAQADYQLVIAGTWQQDLLVTESQVQQMRAEIQKTQTELERHEVRAPTSGFLSVNNETKSVWEVLQINRRPGEYVGTPPGEAIVILADAGQRRIRVDIDEHDLPRFEPNQPAIAFPRGDGKTSYPLSFVRVEPYVVPKRSLTGDNADRVDTRVLQVIYEFENSNSRIYVGQQMDVFIDLSEKNKK
ncbi:HlyD family secretion protein [Rubinisphaera italica]|uniref:Multidrug resistance protein MdtN n=1 Tax=Rubinisphaera italica TaxID=2527969 RepID=A0A5C5XCV8_9PLAN|nr:biotin/lipoyl-binding protein [Rubinisphaera italica]TWT60997.1 Multidrug resistance protein MdtN [Rubinisphaera italica]